MAGGSTNILLSFGRLMTEATARAEILPLLADAAVDHVSADAALVLAVGEDGAPSVVASRDLPEDLSGWRPGPDTVLDSEVGSLLVAQSHGRFAQAHVRLMVSSGGLFGALVFLFRRKTPVEPARLELADGLVDLAATALGRAAQFEQLRKAHADLRASHEMLLRTEKLRALGEMAAGINHDLKNMLNPLGLHLQLLKRAVARSDTAAAESGIKEMEGVIRRGVETVERLRDFSRQAPEAKLEPVDLNHLVHEAASLAKPRMASGKGTLSFIREELGSPPRVHGRAGEIVSALVNLVVNAIDAMPDGGIITLRTGESRGKAWVEVIDNGPGMPPEVEARVFEPFFTTKGQVGTGLGLSMVYACVQRHGGSITLETAPGRGTKFHLSFPGMSATTP